MESRTSRGAGHLVDVDAAVIQQVLHTLQLSIQCGQVKSIQTLQWSSVNHLQLLHAYMYIYILSKYTRVLFQHNTTLTNNETKQLRY